MSQKTNAFTIERILDEEMISNKPHYLVKWQGYSSLEATWQPIENLIDALDIVHQWKVQRKNGSSQKQSDSERALEPLKKTKKICGKDTVSRDKQLQNRLNTRKYLTIDDDDELLNEDQLQNNQRDSQVEQSIPDSQKDNETCQLDFDHSVRSVSPQKSKSSGVGRKNKMKSIQQSEESQSEPSQEEFQKSLRNRHVKNYRNNKNKDKDKEKDVNGFKVIGKVTRQGVKSIIWCFQWQGQKICEVQLKDGRKVNMKKEDVKKICPDKLLQYYEKAQRSKC